MISSFRNLPIHLLLRNTVRKYSVLRTLKGTCPTRQLGYSALYLGAHTLFNSSSWGLRPDPLNARESSCTYRLILSQALSDSLMPLAVRCSAGAAAHMCTVDSVALGMCFAYSVLVVLYDSVQSISRKDHRSRKGGG